MNEKNLVNIADRATDVQREIRSKGGKARAKKIRQSKLVAEALRQVLYEPLVKGSRQTKLDGISIKAIKKLFDNPDIRDIKVLAEILGELKEQAGTNNTVLNINTSPEGARNIQALATDPE